MTKPYNCPGCGWPILTPAYVTANTPRVDGWLEADAWCEACGGSARRGHAFQRTHRWYRAVETAYEKLGLHPGLVLEPDSVEPLWTQAIAGAEARMDDGEDAFTEAAKTTAEAIALLAFGSEILNEATAPVSESVATEAAETLRRAIDGIYDTLADQGDADADLRVRPLYEAVNLLEGVLPEGKTRYLTVRFDVSRFTQEETDYLTGEVLAQAERSEGHPGTTGEVVS